MSVKEIVGDTVLFAEQIESSCSMSINLQGRIHAYFATHLMCIKILQ